MALNGDADKTDAALEQAMEWVLRFQQSPDESRTRDEFNVWLSQSTEHAVAWQQALKTWRLLGEIPPAYEHAWSGPADTRSVENRRRSVTGVTRKASIAMRRWQLAISIPAAGIAACLIILMAPAVLVRMQADYTTTTAQSRIVALEDGSTVQLAPDSAIKLGFSSNRRQVTLLAGEAFFDVKRDPARPFVVEADDVKIEVLGTAFDVRLSSSSADVELARGVVDVSYNGSTKHSAATLAPGQRLVVDRNSGAMTKDDIALHDIASWRDGRIFVNGATIGSVVEQIQRYHAAWIAIPDASLARQTVTGLYDLHDPDRALRALVQPHGGHVHEVSRFARILSRF